MTPVVADVNAAISQVIPVVESAAAEEQPVPQTEVSVPVQVIDPTVSQYIAEAEAWIETAYELLEE